MRHSELVLYLSNLERQIVLARKEKEAGLYTLLSDG
jgi:hypothetical protein